MVCCSSSVMREQLSSGCTALVLLPVAVLSAVPRVRDTLVAFLHKIAECIPRYYERSGGRPGRRSRGGRVRERSSAARGQAPSAKPQGVRASRVNVRGADYLISEELPNAGLVHSFHTENYNPPAIICFSQIEFRGILRNCCIHNLSEVDFARSAN